MNKHQQHFGFKQKLLVVALLVAFGPASADDAAVAKLISPDSTTVSAGVGGVMGDQSDRTIFGQYNGWANHTGGLLLDFELIKTCSRLFLGFGVQISPNNLVYEFCQLVIRIGW